MVTVREVRFDDVEAVAALTQSAGWGAPSIRSWERLWKRNPAAPAQSRLSRGWVLEDGPRLGGFLCNVEQSYHHGGRVLRTAVAGSFVVAPPFRGDSLKLVLAFARQPNVDLWLNTTATADASKIFQFLKFRRMPQRDYDRRLYWVLHARAFSKSALRKMGVPALASSAAAPVVGPALWAAVRLGRHRCRAREDRFRIRVVAPEEIAGDFDDLWQRKLAEGRKLLACRNAGTLRWHYASEGRANPARLICAYEGARLIGYLALVRQDSPAIGLRRAYVADLLVERDDPNAIRQLVSAAAQEAGAGGAAVLEAVGFPDHIRQVLRRCRPFELRNLAWPYLYKVADPELQQDLSCADVWHACLFDGDGSL